jgi:hypothetical protein
VIQAGLVLTLFTLVAAGIAAMGVDESSTGLWCVLLGVSQSLAIFLLLRGDTASHEECDAVSTRIQEGIARQEQIKR